MPISLAGYKYMEGEETPVETPAEDTQSTTEETEVESEEKSTDTPEEGE